MSIKIYTKTGDQGETSLLGGTRLPKHHIRIEAYGNVDELNSWIGLMRDCTAQASDKLLLIEIQDRLFTLGSQLAADPEKNKMQLPELTEQDVTRLENEIDTIDDQLPPMKNFVLPGGHTAVSNCHIARCVCRRTERSVLKLAENEKVQEINYRYLNRLSDYLFMLARKLSLELGAQEIAWKPRT
jgi:cob(I)alamin adenosyltransferase